MTERLRIAFFVIVLGALVVPPTIVSAAEPAMPTIQQQFDAATTALDAERWGDALAIFDTLEARLKGPKSGRSLALVRVRRAEALMRLDRYDEAKASLRRGLPDLPAGDPSLAADRLLGLLWLGEMDEHSLDYADAIQSYRSAEPLASEVDARLRVLAGLIRTEMFFDPETALADADRALALPGTEGAKSNKANFHTLRGRVLLNLKRYLEARQELKTAANQLGGLTMKVDASDIAARSDAAIASLLSNDEEGARKFLAYTGAGRIPGGFGAGADMPPPPCDEEGDLKPEDVAVIEFGIAPDGSVASVAPIYSSRPGAGAIAFARAVSRWSWTPEALKSIPPLFRALTRVELRCSKANQQPSVTRILKTEVEHWLAERGTPVPEDEEKADAQQLQPLRDALVTAESRSGPQSLPVLALLVALADNSVLPAADRLDFARRSDAIARAEHAPAPVLAYFGAQLADDDWRVKIEDWQLNKRGVGSVNLAPLLSDPVIKSDVRSLTAIRLLEADNLYRAANKPKDAMDMLAQVRDTPGLDTNDPLRAAALARLASIQLAAGQAEAARATFASSGLTGEQCALLDTAPRLKRLNASDSDFPPEAQRWGFEGWAAIEYDILANGKTSGARAVIAYPPFVFVDAATGVVKNMQYEQTFRPNSELGCGGKMQQVRFLLPS